jgi:hypothetical protein
MPDEKKPILDPEHELPEPHDMELTPGFEAQIDTPHSKTGSLDAGYAAQLGPTKKDQATLPPTHSPDFSPPSFFSRNRFLVFLLPIILLVVSAAFATYYVSDAQRKEQLPQPTLSARLEPTTFPSPIIETMSDWKHYTNTQFGFSFEYPKGLYLDDQSTQGHVSLSTYAPGETKPKPAAYGLAFWIKPLNKKSLRQYSEAQIAAMKNNNITILVPLQEITLAGEQAYKVHINGLGEFDYYYVLSKYPDTVIEIEIPKLEHPNSKAEAGIDHILATFRLTGAVSPSNALGVKPTDGPSAASKDAEYAAKIDLARKLGRTIYTIETVSVEEKEWSDSSLGCPQNDMMYTQVITPGYLITLSDGVKEYTYHTDIKTRVVNCGK